MPVNSKSPQYEKLEDVWELIYDLEDEDRMKLAGTKYVPKLSEQSSSEYDDYIGRGSLYGAFNRTVRGLTGAIMRKPPEVECPKRVEDILSNITQDGLSIDEVVRKVTRGVIRYGYYGIFPDVDVRGWNPKLALYEPQTILYPVKERVDNVIRLYRLTLSEQEQEFKDDDPYESDSVDYIRELYFEGDVYAQRLWREVEGVWQVDSEIIPRMAGGTPFRFIPFVFFGAMENSIDPKEPPLADLANLNKKHFIVSVDYFHGLHYCGLPTYWAAGFNLDEGESLYVGQYTAWVSDNPNAKCGILQARKESVGAIEAALDKLEKQMAVVGSRMIEQQRRGVETAEGLLIRQASDFAVLSDIASCVESGITRALQYCAMFLGINESEIAKIKVKLNKDFSSDRVDPQVIQAMFQLMQQGNVSMDTLLWYLKNQELLPPYRTIDDEKELIKSMQNKEFLELIVGNASEGINLEDKKNGTINVSTEEKTP